MSQSAAETSPLDRPLTREDCDRAMDVLIALNVHLRGEVPDLAEAIRLSRKTGSGMFLDAASSSAHDVGALIEQELRHVTWVLAVLAEGKFTLPGYDSPWRDEHGEDPLTYEAGLGATWPQLSAAQLAQLPPEVDDPTIQVYYGAPLLEAIVAQEPDCGWLEGAVRAGYVPHFAGVRLALQARSLRVRAQVETDLRENEVDDARARLQQAAAENRELARALELEADGLEARAAEWDDGGVGG